MKRIQIAAALTILMIAILLTPSSAMASRAADLPPQVTVTNEAIPAVPVLVAPANGTTGLADDPTLVWNAVEGADSYDIQLGTKPTFASWNRTKWHWEGTSIRVFYDLEDDTYTFYWRVRARNAAGTSAWSAPWQFTCATRGCD